MRMIRIQNLLDSFITVDDKNKKIVKISCTCRGFQFNNIHKVGKVAHIKYYATPCIHVIRVFDGLIQAGFSLKVPIINEGPTKCTPKIRAAVLEVWGAECFFYGCNETEGLEIHRLIPGFAGGRYSTLNCRPECNLHHKKIHENQKGCH